MREILWTRRFSVFCQWFNIVVGPSVLGSFFGGIFQGGTDFFKPPQNSRPIAMVFALAVLCYVFLTPLSTFLLLWFGRPYRWNTRFCLALASFAVWLGVMLQAVNSSLAKDS